MRDYLLGTTEYVNRLREIVQAAHLPKDREERLLALEKEDLLRAIVDNVGKHGQAGQRLRSVISVAMLSEGWDAKNVTHILGLRAFTSQLLCEQVIGCGLRRVGYDKDENGLFVPEYVNVFGVPLSVFVDTGDDGVPPPPPKPSTQIESLASRNELVQCCMLDGAFKTDAFGRVVRRKPQRYRGIARICNDTAGTKARF